MPNPAKAFELVEVFCSYSHKDEPLRLKFEEQAAELRRKYVQIWHDRKIDPGDDWASEIDHHLNSADIIALFVSSSFLASDFCYTKELTRALERHDRKQAVVVPIIVRPCDWTEAPFARLQAIPRDGKAVTLWSNRDKAWCDVAIQLKRVVKGILQRKMEALANQPATPAPDPPPILPATADLAEIQRIYTQIAADSQKARMERFRIMADLQSRIFEITQDLPPTKAAKKTADAAFRNMDGYIRQE